MSPPSPASPVFDAPSRSAAPGPGSDRTFGFFFAAVIGGIGAWSLWKGHGSGWWGVAAAALLALVAAAAPRLLHGANRLWFALGMLLARIVNPVVIGLMFFLVITPIGLLMRLVGQRPLALERDERLATYWVERSPKGPEPQTMRNQF